MKDVAYCENSKWDFVHCGKLDEDDWLFSLRKVELSLERQSVADGLR